MAKKIKATVEDKEIFAKTLYNEAGSTCGLFEILFIAWCIRNRVEGKKWFGSTYSEVCLKKYQFSCWNKKTKKQILKLKYNNFRYTKCLMIATFVIHEEPKYNPIPRSCYYYEPTLCSPKWARKMRRQYPQLKLKHIYFQEV
jgi:hypothetical protein